MGSDDEFNDEVGEGDVEERSKVRLEEMFEVIKARGERRQQDIDLESELEDDNEKRKRPKEILPTRERQKQKK